MRILFLTIFMLLVSVTAKAQCAITLTTSNPTISWDLNFTYVGVNVTLLKTSNPACNWGVAVSKGTAADYASRAVVDGAKQVPFQIYKETGLVNILKDKPDLTSNNDVITGTLPGGPNRTTTVPYYVQIPFTAATDVLYAAGTYTATYTINVYEGSLATSFGAAIATAGVTLTVSIAKLIEVSIVDSGGTFASGSATRNVSFGVLQEGLSSTSDIRVRTNAGFEVTVSSANNGRMKHTTPGKNSYVPFSFYMNGSLLNLATSSSSPVLALSGAGQTAMTGLGYPMKVVVGSLSGTATLSGAHSDALTLTAITTE